MIQNRSFSLALGIGASVIWGMSFIWYKTAYLGFGPLTVVTLRLVIASILMSLAVVILRKQEKIRKEDWKYFLLLSVFEPFLYFLGESYGMKNVSSTLGSLIIATIPLFTPIPAYLLYKEKMRWNGFVGLAFSFAGVGLVAWQGRIDVINFWGIPFMFVAVLSAVCYGLVLKKLCVDYHGFTIVRVQSIVGLLMFLPLFLFFEAGDFNMQAPPVAWSSVIALAVFASCLAYMFISVSIRNLGLNTTNLLANLIPLFTAVLAFLLLHEPFGLYKIIGGILVLTGVLLYEVVGGKNRVEIANPHL